MAKTLERVWIPIIVRIDRTQPEGACLVLRIDGSTYAFLTWIPDFRVRNIAQSPLADAILPDTCQKQACSIETDMNLRFSCPKQRSATFLQKRLLPLCHEKIKHIMTQFEILQERVDAAVAALPHALNDEQNRRLRNELQAIRDYRRAEMLNAVADIVKDSRDWQVYPTLCANEGYCVSYVCWLLGISDFNPLDHPWLSSERFALNTFRKDEDITLYYDDETDWESAMTRLYGSRAVMKYGVDSRLFEITADTMTFVSISA